MRPHPPQGGRICHPRTSPSDEFRAHLGRKAQIARRLRARAVALKSLHAIYLGLFWMVAPERILSACKFGFSSTSARRDAPPQATGPRSPSCPPAKRCALRAWRCLPHPQPQKPKRKPTVAPAVSTPRPKVNACRHDSCAQSTPGFPLGVWEVPLASSGPSPPRRAFRNSRDRFASSSMVLPHCQETERALQPAGPIGFCGTRLQCMKMRTV